MTVRASHDRAADPSPPIASVPLADVVIVIPARNEEESLPLVLRDLPPVDDVIVVDNGSTDFTAAVAEEGGATLVREERRGYGAACLAGLAEIQRQALFEAKAPPQVVVFLDADYSDYPELLPQLVEPILGGHADFVLGSRICERRERRAMPPHSVLGNRIACWLLRRIWGADYTDLGPFRAIRYDNLQSLGMRDRSFGWTIEMQIKAVVAGLRIQEIPVPYRRRIGVSKISGTLFGSVRAGVKILYVIGKYWWLNRNAGPWVARD